MSKRRESKNFVYSRYAPLPPCHTYYTYTSGYLMNRHTRVGVIHQQGDGDGPRAQKRNYPRKFGAIKLSDSLSIWSTFSCVKYCVRVLRQKLVQKMLDTPANESTIERNVAKNG